MKCKYLWSHLDFKPGGYAPCFRFKNFHGNFGKVPQLPSEMVNSKSWQDARRQMRNGEWPAGCIDCKIQEDNGIKSYRQKSLKSYISEPDYSTDIVKITDLQLKMSRACNFACRHCSTASNSSFLQYGKDNPIIATTLHKDYDFNHLVDEDRIIDIPTPEVIDDLFDNILSNVERIEFSGGEPFYHVDMYKLLERMIESEIDTSKITLHYNTNMSLTSFKNYDIIELWNHFKAIHITVSMDGTGDLFNYFRTNGDYATTLKNLFYTLKKSNKITSILIVCTTCAYHAFYINEIAKDLFTIESKINRLYPHIQVHVRPTFVHWPQGLDLVNLAEDTKQKILDNIVENSFSKEIAIRLKGERTIPQETFKDIVKLQDQVYNRDASELAPRIFDYVY